MNSQKKSIDSFLTEAGMHPLRVDLEATVNHMLGEMKAGLEGSSSSLAMIPTYMDVDAEVPIGKRVVVLDAGGTNLRAALVSFSQDGKPVIEDFSKHPMPGSRGPVSREEFFGTLAAHVAPLLDRGDRVGFCFSYPTHITPDKDGRVIRFSKELRAPEVKGRMIGSDLKEALRASGVQNPPGIVILNDTVATLLTAKAFGGHWGDYVGYILGTGTNSCYVESNAAITKLKNIDSSKHQVINMESGNFAVSCRGEADRRLGAKTAFPETFWFEKMISGGYFGSLTAETVALAVEKNLFSPKAAAALLELDSLSTKDADNYCHNPSDTSNPLVKVMRERGGDADAERLWFLIDALLERAARLTAAGLAAAVLKGGGRDGPMKAVCITMDGTTYYAYYRFHSRVETHLRPFLTDRNRYYEIQKVDNAPLIGAAVAALTN